MALTTERRTSKRQADQRRVEAHGWRTMYKTSRWAARRRHQLQTEPLCRMCLDRGVVRAATIADHVIPHRGDSFMFFNGKLQSLCKPDHDKVKQREEARGYAEGVDQDGWPADPRHPANAACGPVSPGAAHRGPPGGVKSLGPLSPGPAGGHFLAAPHNKQQGSE